MTELFDGEVQVHYGYAFLQSEDADPTDDFGRAGQVNGLCGAAIPEVVSFTFGMHTGSVPLRIEAWEAVPDLPAPGAADWQEIVEATLTTRTAAYTLAAFEDYYPVPMPATGTFRVRFSASGMDAAHDADPRAAGDPVIDRYLVQLRPEREWRPDEVLRVTSHIAAYWHREAQGRVRPPARPRIRRSKRARPRSVRPNRPG